MIDIGLMPQVTSLGAAGIMGAMWLWERRTSVQRERELNQAHDRILRDEQRIDVLTKVVDRNTAAISSFAENQRETCEILKHIHEELHHAKDS